MPRLSLYRPEKGNDFRFIDRVIEEQFQVGGTDVFVHKYLGPATEGVDAENTPSSVGQTSTLFPELSIQDVILMENRDRKYSPDVYVMRTIYQMQDLDFNLSQFGIFLNNDNLFLHFHLRNCVDTLERKLMAGDVLELPHLKDEYALDDSLIALKRFYVVQDVTRAANGFSQTWYPHLLRVKCVPLVDTQEYKDILDQIQTDSNGNEVGSLRDIISTYNQNIAINETIVAQAEADAPLSGYDTNQMYVLPFKDDTELLNLNTVDLDSHIPDASWDWEDTSGAITSETAPVDPQPGDKWLDLTGPDGHSPVLKVWNGHFWQGNPADASSVYKSPARDLYVGYLTGDGRPPNGAPYSFGITFPTSPIEGQFHLRTDYFPNRLFRWNGTHWMKFEDNVRMTLSNTYDETVVNDVNVPQETKKMRQTQRTGFINNNSTATIAGQVVQERQALSKALKPKADN